MTSFSTRRLIARFVPLSALGLALPLAAGCSGGGGSPSTGGPAQSSDLPASVTFSIVIPQSTATAASAERPQYISQSTRSLVVTTDSKNPVTVPLTSQSPNCTSGSGTLSCQATIKSPAGKNYYTLTTYPSTNGTGSALSTDMTGYVTVAAGQTTPVAVTLHGIVDRAVLSLATTKPPVGKAAAIPLSVVLEDAGGNVITGTAAYKYPVTLTTSDPAHGPLSKTTLSAPADASGIVVNYDGARVSSITYGASATQLPVANVTDAVLTPQ